MYSMTGCGRSQLNDGTIQITVELKCVNHRFLDINCRLPHHLSFLQGTIRQQITRFLHRGHIEVFFSLRALSAQDSGISINSELAHAYLAGAKEIADSTNMTDSLTVYQLMKMPGVVTVSDPLPDEQQSKQLCAKATAEAVQKVLQMRACEGIALKEDLTNHLNAADELRKRIAQRSPVVVEEYRNKLKERIAQLGVECDSARLAQQVALMADRSAIDEQLSRLESHISQMRIYLDSKSEIGKKMDFMIQQMNREANTTGSKCADAQIAQMVVDLKSEIEKLREQIQNVE